MLIFMNMRDIFLQLTATDPTRLKIETAKRPDIFKPNTKIEQKQAHREKLRSTNTIVEQTQVHRDKPRPIVEL
jgi:LPS O-antigen subunit length determinant protein (WzzB/FepE family)